MIFPDRTAASETRMPCVKHEGKTLEVVSEGLGSCTLTARLKKFSVPTGTMKILMDASGKIIDNWSSTQ